MPSAYILLLIVSLVAVGIYWKTSQDIFVIVALAGLGCFLWGFSWLLNRSACDYGVAVRFPKMVLARRSKF